MGEEVMGSSEPGNSHEHEIAFVRTFCAASRRERYLKLLESQKGRSKFRHLLYHNIELLQSVLIRIPNRLQTVEEIEAELRRRGAGDICYCISTSDDYDGKFLPLRETLNSLVGFGDGTILSLIPGELCFYEGEEPKCRVILAVK